MVEQANDEQRKFIFQLPAGITDQQYALGALRWEVMHSETPAGRIAAARELHKLAEEIQKKPDY